MTTDQKIELTASQVDFLNMMTPETYAEVMRISTTFLVPLNEIVDNIMEGLHG